MLDSFYMTLERLSQLSGGPRLLQDCSRRQDWPNRGVYFFFEEGEMRSNGPALPRVVRVGTHGITLGSKSTLYGRLVQHRGNRSGSGNHRGSVFRRHIGKALIARQAINCITWGVGSNAPLDVRLAEKPIELQVSRYLGRMSVLCLRIVDDTGPNSLRAYIERNSIGLLAGKEPASRSWLGSFTANPNIIRSHLWNVNHIDHAPERDFLKALENLVEHHAV